ncbi:conjugal transfer protein [Citrobacter amalonaticus]
MVGGPVGDFELLLCHGTVCVVGKMRDLILQLSKSSIYSTKPCHSAERSFFTIVKKNKHGFLPDHTADARGSFLRECSSADPAIIGQIIRQFGRIRG